MKALTLHQPFATLVAMGEKKIETRSWPTTYRGSLAIHAAKEFPKEYQALLGQEPFLSVLEAYCSEQENDEGQFPRGAVIAIAQLVDCFPQFTPNGNPHIHQPHPDTNEFHFGHYARGRYMWILKDVQLLAEPIPCRGYQQLWNWSMPAGVLA